MAAESRKQLPLLVGLLAVLLLVLWWQFGAGTSEPVVQTAARPPAAQATSARGPAAASTAALFARGVALDRLSEDRPAPEEGGRDPFRTGASTAPEPGGGGSAALRSPAIPPPVTPTLPQQPPGPPPPRV